MVNRLSHNYGCILQHDNTLPLTKVQWGIWDKRNRFHGVFIGTKMQAKQAARDRGIWYPVLKRVK